MQIMK